MVGDEKPVYLEYDMPDADFIKKKNEEDEEKNPSDDEMSICSIQSIDPELKSKLTEAVSDSKFISQSEIGKRPVMIGQRSTNGLVGG